MHEKIKQMRLERKWSQEKLGQLCGHEDARSQIHKLENGLTKLSLDWIERLASAFGESELEFIPPNWFENHKFSRLDQNAMEYAITVTEKAIEKEDAYKYLSVLDRSKCICEIYESYKRNENIEQDPQPEQDIDKAVSMIRMVKS